MLESRATVRTWRDGAHFKPSMEAQEREARETRKAIQTSMDTERFETRPKLLHRMTGIWLGTASTQAQENSILGGIKG